MKERPWCVVASLEGVFLVDRIISRHRWRWVAAVRLIFVRRDNAAAAVRNATDDPTTAAIRARYEALIAEKAEKS